MRRWPSQRLCHCAPLERHCLRDLAKARRADRHRRCTNSRPDTNRVRLSFLDGRTASLSPHFERHSPRRPRRRPPSTETVRHQDSRLEAGMNIEPSSFLTMAKTPRPITLTNTSEQTCASTVKALHERRRRRATTRVRTEPFAGGLRHRPRRLPNKHVPRRQNGGQPPSCWTSPTASRRSDTFIFNVLERVGAPPQLFGFVRAVYLDLRTCMGFHAPLRHDPSLSDRHTPSPALAGHNPANVSRPDREVTPNADNVRDAHIFAPNGGAPPLQDGLPRGPTSPVVMAMGGVANRIVERRPVKKSP